jgi:hypothetical protein
MRKRIEALEDQIHEPETEAGKLVHLGEQWLEAVHNRKWKAATEVAEKASGYFADHPGWIDNPPEYVPKILFINWRWFSRFQNEEVRNFYRECIQKNIAPNLKNPRVLGG